MDQDAKFCSECGQAILVPTPPFCSQCGAKLAYQSDTPPSESEIPPEPPIVDAPTESVMPLEVADKSTEEQVLNAIRSRRNEIRVIMDQDAKGCLKWTLIVIGGIVFSFIVCVGGATS